MNGIYHLVRLTRPVNLILITLTMVVIRYVLIANHMKWEPAISGLSLPFSVFAASVTVVLLLAASGNMINDYFDQKVDRINKPERVIVGKHVKRRVAIILHHAFNVIAVGLTVFICAETNSWWALSVPVIMATLLWFYSPVFKKQPFIGNLIVAICVAIIPFWATVFEINALSHSYSDGLFGPQFFFSQLWYRVAAYCGFAFVLTLAREAVKDMEDLEGDKLEGYRTLPVVWGVQKTTRYAAILVWLCVPAVLVLAFLLYTSGQYNQVFIGATFTLAAVLAYTASSVGRSGARQEFSRASRWLKVAMACGVLYLFFI